MSGTLTVKELIKELLEHDMDDDVYIELDDGKAEIMEVQSRSSGPMGLGVNIVPRVYLIDKDQNDARPV